MSSSAPTSESHFGAHLSRQLDLPYQMICKLADDFTDEQAKQRVGDSKPLVWFLAHVIITRNYFLTLYGGGGDEAVDAAFVARFGRGSDGAADMTDSPSKGELLAIFERITERARALVATLAPEDLDREAEGDVRHPLFKTLGTAITLVTAHDGYHAGQIGVLRRSMGKDPLFG